MDVGTVKGAPQTKTVWKSVEMYFNIEDSGLGRINGRGTLVGSDNQAIPFLLEGSVRWPYTKIVKVNMSQFVNSQKFVLKIDVTNMRMDGEHKQGTLRLSRTGPVDLSPFVINPTINSAANPVINPVINQVPSNPLANPPSNPPINTSSPALSSITPGGTGAPTNLSSGTSSSPAISNAPVRSSQQNTIASQSNSSQTSSSTSSTRRSRDSSSSGSNATSTNSAATGSNNVSYASVRDFVLSLFGPSGLKYAKALEEHEVDMEALRLMNESHLREMGLPMGPRLKILAQLGGAPPT